VLHHGKRVYIDGDTDMTVAPQGLLLKHQYLREPMKYFDRMSLEQNLPAVIAG
jgi:hypothetical protein